MFSNSKKYSVYQIISFFGGFTIIFFSTSIVLSYEENFVRNVNERIQSIASGKLKFNKTSYDVEKIRYSTPNTDLIVPQTSSKFYETISPKTIVKLRFSPIYYSQKKFGKQIIRGTYASNSKGRYRSFNADTNGIKRFCNTNATTHFCIREGETTIRYMGNTPRRHARELDISDKNIFHKRNQSKKFAQQLLKQSNRWK